MKKSLGWFISHTSKGQREYDLDRRFLRVRKVLVNGKERDFEVKEVMGFRKLVFKSAPRTYAEITLQAEYREDNTWEQSTE